MHDQGSKRPPLAEELRSARDELRRMRRLGGGLRPSNTGALVFSDLFDLDEIQQVQDAFALATGVASFITAPDGTPMTRPSNFCRLCSDIIRTNEEGRKRCIASDAFFGRRCGDKTLVSHCLSAGLLEGGAAITAGDTHLANWLVGQVRDEKTPIDELLRHADTIGADHDAYREALNEIPVMSRERFGLICDALYLFARLMSRQALFNLRQGDEIQRRRKMLKKLKQSRRIADTLLNATPDAALLMDSDGTVMAANMPAALLHKRTSPDDMVETNIHTTMDWSAFEQRLLHAHDCLCSGVPIQMEETTEDHVFETHLTPVYMDTETATAVAVFSHDVTEERRLQRMRDDVERIARHDIKSPLTGIIGLSRLLAGQENLTPKQQDVAATIADAASNTLQKLNTQFDLFRMEEGTYILKTELFDLAATLRRTAQVLHTITRHKSLALKMRINGESVYGESMYGEDPKETVPRETPPGDALSGKAPSQGMATNSADTDCETADSNSSALRDCPHAANEPVEHRTYGAKGESIEDRHDRDAENSPIQAMMHGEEFHIEGMLQNLIQNAIEAAPKESTVYVDVDMGLSGCVIDIHNLGAIPEKIRQCFFDKYATAGKASGTGLGTYSARLIARAHQGDISFCTDENGGTTVTVTLPQPGGDFFPEGAQ